MVQLFLFFVILKGFWFQVRVDGAITLSFLFLMDLWNNKLYNQGKVENRC